MRHNLIRFFKWAKVHGYDRKGAYKLARQASTKIEVLYLIATTRAWKNHAGYNVN